MFCLGFIDFEFTMSSWAFIDSTNGRLTSKSREVSKPRDWGLNFANHSDIWQAPRQQRCRDACQISERYDHYNIQSPGFETSRDLAVRRPSQPRITSQTMLVIGIDHDTLCAGRRGRKRPRNGRHNSCCAGLQYQPLQRRPYKWSISILPRSQFYKK